MKRSLLVLEPGDSPGSPAGKSELSQNKHVQVETCNTHIRTGLNVLDCASLGTPEGGAGSAAPLTRTLNLLLEAFLSGNSSAEIRVRRGRERHHRGPAFLFLGDLNHEAYIV